MNKKKKKSVCLLLYGLVMIKTRCTHILRMRNCPDFIHNKFRSTLCFARFFFFLSPTIDQVRDRKKYLLTSKRMGKIDVVFGNRVRSSSGFVTFHFSADKGNARARVCVFRFEGSFIHDLKCRQFSYGTESII